MSEQIIIAKSDINEYYNIGKNINQDRVDPHIRAAQVQDLQPILGKPLYYAFIEDYNGTNFATPIYAALFAGKVYKGYDGKDIYFRGVKPMLIAFAYDRLVGGNSIHVTRGGVGKKAKEEVENDTSAEILQMVRSAKSDANQYKHELLDFLNQESANYTLWKGSTEGSGTKTAFNITRSPRHPSIKSY